jgi:hypothetical protein
LVASGKSFPAGRAEGYNPTAAFRGEDNVMSERVLTADGQSGLSEIERVVDTFIAPKATFKDILRSASWWLPFVLLVVSSLATAFTVERKVGFDQAYDNQVRMSPKTQERMADLTPEQKAQSAKFAIAITK